MEESVEDINRRGFEAFFEGAKYSQETSIHWINGWVIAERESRCGHFDRYGRPTPCYA